MDLRERVLKYMPLLAPLARLRFFLKPISTLVFGLSIVLTGILIGLFIHLGWIGFISDSEIWSVTLAKNISTQWQYPWVFSRPLFYLPLAAAVAPFTDAVQIFLAAKAVMIVNGALMLFFTFRLAKALTLSTLPTARIVPWAALIFLLANSGFQNQGYRIRSDMIATTVFLFVLERTIVLYGKSPKVALLWLAPLLATPKAIFQLLPMIVFPVFRHSRKVFAVFLLIFSGLLLYLYPTAWEYFVHSFHMVRGDHGWSLPYYLFMYVSRLVEKNQLILGVFVFRTATLFAGSLGRHFSDPEYMERQNRFFYFVLLSLAVMLMYPQKVPFYLAAFLPVISVFSALLLQDLWLLAGTAVEAKRRMFFRRASVLCFALVLIALGVSAKREWEVYRIGNNSEFQFEAIRAIDKYLKGYPKAEYYDAVGLIPSRATIFRFAGPDDPTMNEFTGRWLDSNPPNLIFYVQKINFLGLSVPRLLEREYFQVGNGVFARWLFLVKPQLISSDKARDDIRSWVYTAAAYGGMEDPEKVDKFSALVQAGKKEPWRVEVSLDELFELPKKEKGVRLLAVSPFLSMEEEFRPLHHLIRFDTQY